MVSAPTIGTQIGNHDLDLLEERAGFLFRALFCECDKHAGIPEPEQHHIAKRQPCGREPSEVTTQRLELESGLANDSPEPPRFVLPPEIRQLLALNQFDQIWQRRTRFWGIIVFV